MFGPLAQAERHPLEIWAGLAVRARDEQLDQLGQHGLRAGPAGVDVVGDLTPAQHGQPLGRGEPFDGGGYHGPFGRNKGQADRIGARSGQTETTYGAEEIVRYLGKNPGPVPGAGVAALRAPVFQMAQHPQGPGHHVVPAAP